MTPMTTHRCLFYAAGGAALGFAAVAHAQAPESHAILGDELNLLLEVLRVGGLPGILGYLAFRVARMVDSLALTVRLHDDDRRMLEELLANRCKADEER